MPAGTPESPEFPERVTSEFLEPTPRGGVTVKETILAGKLRRHRGVYKALLDTVRVACANIEAELATLLAPHLSKPAEAKKTLAVLFAAPGRVRVGAGTIAITLAPAGSPDEHEAYR